MDKKNGSFLARFRGWFQAGAALLTNIHLPNFAKGVLYQGKGKTVCVPGLNCYSCPGWATSNSSVIAQRVLGDVEENDIILLHDASESSVLAAFKIIDELKAQGYTFVTVEDILLE